MEKHGLDHSFHEHVADGVVHVLGVAAALIGATALVIWAAYEAPLERIPPLIAYSIGLIATFSLSAAYNMTLHKRARAILRRFDHAAIFIMIAGTYTPLAVIAIGGWVGIAMASAAWVIAALGVFLKLFFFHRFYRATFALYLVQGWLAVLAIGPMRETMSPTAQALVVAGGLTYTIGTLFHHAEHWPFNRAIWHAMVLAAAATHYVAIFQVVGTA